MHWEVALWAKGAWQDTGRTTADFRQTISQLTTKIGTWESVEEYVRLEKRSPNEGVRSRVRLQFECLIELWQYQRGQFID